MVKQHIGMTYIILDTDKKILEHLKWRTSFSFIHSCLDIEVKNT